MNKNLFLGLSVASLLFFIDGLTQRTLATDVSGIISSDTTWDLAESPYVVTGTVLVSSGVKLTVEAGVEAKFASGTSLQVFGELVARGTSSSGITFTSAQESKAAGDWGADRVLRFECGCQLRWEWGLRQWFDSGVLHGGVR